MSEKCGVCGDQHFKACEACGSYRCIRCDGDCGWCQCHRADASIFALIASPDEAHTEAEKP